MGEKSLHGPCCNPTWAVCRAKSFADDLVTERGIVNGRVAPCYDPLRLSLRGLQPSFIGVSKGEIPSLGGVTSERPLQLVVALLPVEPHCCSVYAALLLCLCLGESSAGRATVCDMHFAHISKCVSRWQPASQPLDICARARFASVHDVHDG